MSVEQRDTEIVIKCRKLSDNVVNCRDVCRGCRDIFFFTSPSRRPLLVFAEEHTPRPLKIAGVLRSKDCFCIPHYVFPIFQAFFCASFFHKKLARFLKSHRLCRTEGLQKQNCARHSRFSMVPKISDYTYF